MPSATLLFLVLVIGLLLFTNFGADMPEPNAEGDPVNMMRIPWFLRYNAPWRSLPGARHVAPSLARAPAMQAADGGGNGFSGSTPRIV